MKKVVCFGLCFLIVLSSFVMSFADSYPSVSLPVGDTFETASLSPYHLYYSSASWTYSGSDNDVFLAVLQEGTNYRYIALSPNPDRVVYISDDSSIRSSHGLTSYSDGYYFSSGFLNSFNPSLSNVPITESTISDFVSGFFQSNSVFFSITDLVTMSSSWLLSLANAVIQSDLLLLLCLFGFCGVAIGLLRRFING